MDIPPALLQFLGSLAAILLLAAIARWFKLGPERRLESEAHARAAAEEASHGFEPVEIALDHEGRGALLRDAGGRVLLLRPHGTHFAGRFLTSAASARSENGKLTVDTAEKRFGSFALALDDPDAWVRHIDAVKERDDA